MPESHPCPLSRGWSQHSDQEPPVLPPRQLPPPFLTGGVGAQLGPSASIMPGGHQGLPSPATGHWPLSRDRAECTALPGWAQGWLVGSYGTIALGRWRLHPSAGGSPLGWVALFVTQLGTLRDINMFFSKAVNLPLAVFAVWVIWKCLLKGTR